MRRVSLAMPATAMFSNLKSRVGGGGGGTHQPQNVLDHNPITQYFEIGKVVASAGPEHIWKIYDAYRKSDGKVSVFQSFPVVLRQFCKMTTPYHILPHSV